MKGLFKRKSHLENVDESQIIKKKKMKKKTKVILFSGVALILASAIVVGCLAAFLPKTPIHEPGQYSVVQFSSKNALVARLAADGQSFDSIFGGWRSSSPLMEFGAPTANIAVDDSDSDDTQVSSTNVQVQGLDEADIVKVDGNYIYTLSYNILRIIEVSSGQMEVVWTSDFIENNFYADEIMLYEDRLAVLGRSYTVESGDSVPDYSGPLYDEAVSYPGYYYNYYSSMIAIRIYDITDRSTPVLENEIKQSGYYNTARLSGSTLYYVAQYNYYDYNVDSILPKVQNSIEEDAVEMDLADIYYIEGLPQNTYTTVGKIDLTETFLHEYNSFIAGSATVYFSGDNIYLCDYNYYSQFISNGFVSLRDNSVSGTTRIVKIGADDLEISAVGEVEGIVSDRYWLDEFQGNLRIATVTGWNQYSNVFILNENLEEIGKISQIAPGESIYSVRFTGETGSMVTFRQVDPLFLLNLSDPYNPSISEGLKKEGVSYYLHPIEGTDLTIGLGRETNENGVTQGIEVVLFDYSGEEAVIVGNPIVIGEDLYAYSEALYNPRAILYDKEKNIFAFSADYTTDFYTYNYINGYFIIGFSAEGLEIRKEIQHIGSNINRSVIIGDYLYAISLAKITSHALLENEIGDVFATL
jgi:inhibitor of cysteine peptidase